MNSWTSISSDNISFISSGWLSSVSRYGLLSIFNNPNLFNISLLPVTLSKTSLFSLIIISKQKLPFEFHKNYICLNKFFALHEIKLGLPIALQDFLVGISFL